MVRHVLTDDEKSCMLLVMRTLSIVDTSLVNGVIRRFQTRIFLALP